MEKKKLNQKQIIKQKGILKEIIFIFAIIIVLAFFGVDIKSLGDSFLTFIGIKTF